MKEAADEDAWHPRGRVGLFTVLAQARAKAPDAIWHWLAEPIVAKPVGHPLLAYEPYAYGAARRSRR